MQDAATDSMGQSTLNEPTLKQAALKQAAFEQATLEQAALKQAALKQSAAEKSRFERGGFEGSRNHGALIAIGVGGLIGGTLDLTQACVLFGWDVPYSIAAGLVGPRAVHPGAAMWLLGVLLHFFICFSFAAFYYASSRRLPFLREYPLVCGLAYGMGLHLVMSLVVLPLSALHARGPYELHDLIVGLLVHMVVMGLPIAYGVRWFSKPV